VIVGRAPKSILAAAKMWAKENHSALLEKWLELNP
jgi:hypothetical protein